MHHFLSKELQQTGMPNIVPGSFIHDDVSHWTQESEKRRISQVLERKETLTNPSCFVC
jgi:hypothetical protein